MQLGTANNPSSILSFTKIPKDVEASELGIGEDPKEIDIYLKLKVDVTMFQRDKDIAVPPLVEAHHKKFDMFAQFLEELHHALGYPQLSQAQSSLFSQKSGRNQLGKGDAIAVANLFIKYDLVAFSRDWLNDFNEALEKNPSMHHFTASSNETFWNTFYERIEEHNKATRSSIAQQLTPNAEQPGSNPRPGRQGFGFFNMRKSSNTREGAKYPASPPQISNSNA